MQIVSCLWVVLRSFGKVHWVYPYEKLRPANVLATITALELVATGKPKGMVFVSSTSAIDTDHYVRLSDSLADSHRNFRGVPESDNLEGARSSLKSGYGQSKWVSEKLLMEAGQRGLCGHIVRPGYVVGDSKMAGTYDHCYFTYYMTIDVFAVTNTDDFIWRMVKGCLQLGLIPDINNTINMVPVDHVAACAAFAAVAPLPDAPMSVLHVTARPLPTFNNMLACLSMYGYAVEQCEYLVWRRRLEQHVMEAQDNALFPLLHFVLDDLPTSTKAPELDDSNTHALLKLNNQVTSVTVSDDLMGLYLAWLVEAGFLPPPTLGSSSLVLPTLQNAGKVRAAGRTGV